MYIVLAAYDTHVTFKTGTNVTPAREARPQTVKLAVWQRFAATDEILKYGRR